MPASLPVRANAAAAAVALAPSGGGGLFAAMPTTKGTVLASLDREGKVRPGWPLLLRKATGCEIDADRADGSVRAVCSVGKAVRAFALDAAGGLRAGWPVNLPAGELPTWMSAPVRVVDGSLHVVLTASNPASARVVRVSRDGGVTAGKPVVDPDAYAFPRAMVGPDGTAYALALDDGTAIWALDLDGVRPGFPVRLDGWASSPAFGRDGRLYLAVDDPDDAEEPSPSSQVVALTGDGRTAPGWPVTLPVDTWTAFGDPTGPPFPPVVVADGTVYVTGWTGRMVRTVAYALDPSGARRSGWPYRAAAPIRWGRPTGVTTCECKPCVVPHSSVHTPPTGGPDGSLLLTEIADANPGGGNRLVAVRADGTRRAGWPVRLDETGSWFATVADDGGRAVFAYAVEPAGTRHNACGERYTVYAGTVVALNGHGDPVYTTTLVAP